MSDAAPFTGFGGNEAAVGGRRRSRRAHKGRTLKSKTLRRMLKKKGLKTTGKKVTLMKRLHMRGGADSVTYRKIGDKWFAVDDKGGKVDVEAVGTDEMPADGVAYVESSGAAASAAEPAAEPAEAGRRRRRSRRREEGGRRRGRKSRHGEMLGF